MVRKNLVKITSIALIAALAAGTTACSMGATEEDLSSVTITQDSINEDKLEETMSSSAFGSTNTEADKVETVYVMADNQGSVNEVIVSDWLKNADASATIADTSSLSDIVNVKGNETYTKNDDGTITWNANGSDIYYQGTTDSELPVSVKISYQLNGEDISPEDLAGKSGNVTIRFDYTNNSKKTIEIDGEETEIYTPFAMISGVMLDSSKFTNVEVTNGKVVTDANNYVVMGVALPGLKDSLALDEDKLDDLELEEDITIPEYVEITAYTSSFEMPMTLTMATSDALSDLGFTDLSNSDSIKKIKDDMDELQDGSTQLVDGTSELLDGTTELKDGTQELTDGAGELKDGSKDLKDGVDAYTDGVSQIASGAGTLDTGIGTLQSGVSSLSSGASQLNSGIGTAKSGADQLTSGLSSAASGASELANGAAAVDAGVGTLAAGVSAKSQTYAYYAQVIASEYGSILSASSSSILQTYGATATQVAAQGEEAEAAIEALTAQLGEAQKLIEELQGNSTADADDETEDTTEETDVDNDEEQKDEKGADTGSETGSNNGTGTPESTEDIKDEVEDDDSGDNDGDNDGDKKEDGSGEGTEDTNDSAKASVTLGGYRNCDASEAAAIVEALTGLDDTTWQTMVAATNAYLYYQASGTLDAEKILTYGPTAATTVTLLQTIYSSCTSTASQLSAMYNGTGNGDGIVDLKNGTAKLSSGASTLNTGLQTLYSGMVSLDTGLGQLATGGNTLVSGTASLSDGVAQLKDGSSQLASGATTLNSNSQALKDGASKLYDGTVTLSDGTVTLNDGVGTLLDGVKELSDGMIKFDEEGIQKLSSAFDGDIQSFADRLQAIEDASKDYTSFSGVADDSTSSVKFIIKTEGIDL